MPLQIKSATRARTKIIATVGPACSSPALLADLIDAGTDVFRLNMAHGNRGQHEEAILRIRDVSRNRQQPIGVLIDLAGPKIRLGQLFQEPVQCNGEDEFHFVRGARATAPHELVGTYSQLVDKLAVGDSIILADGAVSLIVEEKQLDRIRCRVTQAGIIRSRQGINLPGVKLGIPSMTEDDHRNAVWAAQNDVDYVGLSFVRTASDIRQLKKLLSQHDSDALVVAKIEKPDALQNLEDIASYSDAVMVARGDLGVETEVSETAIVQKRIIRICNRLARPVIVATQMLDSMQQSVRPTRAETTDVANAVLDGADACMLSGETAIGDYPREAVSMMNRILIATERSSVDEPHRESAAAPLVGVHAITAAVVHGAAEIAERLCAKLVVISTRTGATALAKSSRRDFVPTVAVSDSERALQRMSLFWGITPVPGAPRLAGEPLRQFVNQWGKHDGSLVAGDRIVMVTGSDIVPGAHNQVVVHEVE